jgi:hypothetical protein
MSGERRVVPLPRTPGAHRRPARGDAGVLEPRRDFFGVEPDQVTPFHERDPALGDQPTDVTLGLAEVLGDAGDVEQLRQTARAGSTRHWSSSATIGHHP